MCLHCAFSGAAPTREVLPGWVLVAVGRPFSRRTSHAPQPSPPTPGLLSKGPPRHLLPWLGSRRPGALHPPMPSSSWHHTYHRTPQMVLKGNSRMEFKSPCQGPYDNHSAKFPGLTPELWPFRELGGRGAFWILQVFIYDKAPLEPGAERQEGCEGTSPAWTCSSPHFLP